MTNTIRTSEEQKITAKNPTIMFFMILLLIGALFGTLIFCNMQSSEISNLSFITQGFIKNKTEQTFVQSLINSFTTSSLLVTICFFLGFGAISQPVEFLVPIFRGLGLGTSISYIYITYGVKGLLITLVLIIPNAVISSIAIIIAARESIKLSNMFTSYIISNNTENNMKSCIKLYVLKFLILFAIIGLSSILDSLLAFLFAGILL